MPTQSEVRRYTLSLLAAMTLYATVLVGSIYWLRRCPPAPWRYVIAVLPVLPVLYVPVAGIRFVRAMDELQRRIQIEGLAFGFSGAAVLTLTYGFLQNAGLPPLNWTWVFPVMSACWIAGIGVAYWRCR